MSKEFRLILVGTVLNGPRLCGHGMMCELLPQFANSHAHPPDPLILMVARPYDGSIGPEVSACWISL